MNNSKEIKDKITGIKTVHKITKAIEMIAASKLKKFKLQREKSIHYAKSIQEIMKRVSFIDDFYNVMSYFKDRKDGISLFVVVSGVQGFCGNLHTNLYKTLEDEITKHIDRGNSIALALLGDKCVDYFNNSFWHSNIIYQKRIAKSEPNFKDVLDLSYEINEYFIKNNVSSIYVCSNKFKSASVYVPSIYRLIPISTLFDIQSDDYLETYMINPFTYEKDSKLFISSLISRYIESVIYQIVLENSCCESAARMIAMQGACENADKMVNDLTIESNRIRQKAITQGVIEINNGAQVLIGDNF